MGKILDGMEMTILRSSAFFFKYTNDDVAPLRVYVG